MKVGCDIDGVLSVGFRPTEQNYFIISGRLVNEWETTLKELGTKNPIYLRPNGGYGNTASAMSWKAQMINSLGITDFYEDNEQTVGYLWSHCRECRVHLVGLKDGKYQVLLTTDHKFEDVEDIEEYREI